ncbi:hypothetical protein AN652_15820, partial [Xanthomonas arboricola pv. pruni]
MARTGASSIAQGGVSSLRVGAVDGRLSVDACAAGSTTTGAGAAATGAGAATAATAAGAASRSAGFATAAGLGVIDPARVGTLQGHRVPIVFERLLVDGMVQPLNGLHRFGAETRRIAI